VEENTEKAMELYRKAAELGYSNAQYKLTDGLKKRTIPNALNGI
jgi:TPR repeat protein